MKVLLTGILFLAVGFGVLPSIGQATNNGCGKHEYYHCDFSGRPCVCMPKPNLGKLSDIQISKVTPFAICCRKMDIDGRCVIRDTTPRCGG